MPQKIGPLATAANRAAAGRPQSQGERVELAAALASARVLHPFTIPRLNVPAQMTLVSTARTQVIEGLVWRDMRGLGIEFSGATEGHYELRRAAYTLADAVLDSKGISPLSDVEDWLQVDPDTIADCYRVYRDVKEAHDPVDRDLSDEEYAIISEAVKKKQPTLLRYIGSRMLSRWLLCTDGQRSNSPQQTFGNTASSLEPSMPTTSEAVEATEGST